jgi:glycolate oxidase FAD binding subunit
VTPAAVHPRHDRRGSPSYNTRTVETLPIDDVALTVRRPADAGALRTLVGEAAASGQGVYPVGGRTTLDVGLPPAKPGFALDTTALNRVIDYPARDMTVTVQAGITVAALQAELAKEGQWLPIDVANPEAATVGGAVALNKSGPRRFGFGTLRDYVIGVSFAADDGTEVKAGGRVVKNVAGYDLMKAQVGAVGTLGVVTQVTLKVKPRPEAEAAVAFGCDTSVGPVLDLLHASKSRPVAVELLNREAWRAAGLGHTPATDWVIAVGFAEKKTTVAWQVGTLLGELKAAPVRDVTEIDGDVWDRVTALQVRPESRFIWKVSERPSRVAEVAQALPAGSLVHADALSGVVWCHPAGGAPPDRAVVRRCPVGLKKTLPVWGYSGGDWGLMKHLKRTLDPKNVFNPGRLFADV